MTHRNGMWDENNDRGACDGGGGSVVDSRSGVFAEGRRPDSVGRDKGQRKGDMGCWYGERAWEPPGWENCEFGSLIPPKHSHNDGNNELARC